MKKDIIAAEIFCGIGGLTKGLLDAGITVIKGYDIDPGVAETYEKNNKTVKFFIRDVSTLKGKEILEGIDRKRNFFLLAGCAPCQPFSLINQENAEYDERKILVLQFARLIKETKPDFIFMENVPGLMKGRGKDIFKKFLRVLDNENYFYDFNILDAKDYGVPQRRKRFVFIASKNKEIKLPEPTYGPKSKEKKRFVNVRDAISKYMNEQPGEKSKIPNHEIRKLGEINKLRLKFIKKNGGSRNDLPENLVLECHKNYKGHGDVYGRMKWDNPAPTLTCKCTSISNGRFAHPSKNRGISVREAAALQTFRDDYIFYGSLTKISMGVGNAVPVKFAESIGRVFLKNA